MGKGIVLVDDPAKADQTDDADEDINYLRDVVYYVKHLALHNEINLGVMDVVSTNG